MHSDPLSLIVEYAGSADAVERRNAVTALAVAGVPESLERLAILTVEDPDEGVRRRGEQEIQRLKPEGLAMVLPEVIARLRHSPYSVRAYALLGRLHNSGATMPFGATGSLLARVAWALAGQARAGADGAWRHRARAFASGLGGGVLGALVVGVLLGLTEDLAAPEDVAGLLSLGALAAGVLTVCVVERSLPFNLHFDPAAGIIAELLTAAVGAAAFGLAGGLLLAAATGGGVAAVVQMLVVLVLSAVAVRLGTALVPGQLGGAVATGVTAFLVGAGTGIAALSIGTGFSIPLGEWLNGPASSDDIRNVWLLLLPAVFGLAFAVARRDGRMLFRGDSTMTWRGKLAMGLLVVHVFAGAGWVFGLAEQTIDLIGGPPMLRVSENLDAAKDFVEDPTAKVRRRELDLSSVPAAVTLTLASPAPIRVTLPSDLPTDFVLLFYEIPSDGLGTPRLVGLQRQDSSERFYRFRDDPPTLGQVRGEPADVEQLKPPPGTYAIVADTFTEWSAARSGSNGSLGAQLSTAQIYDRAMSRLTWSRLRTWFRQTPGTEEQQRAVVAVSSVAPYRLVVEIETDRAAEVEASIRSNPVYREALDASNARSLTQAEIDEIDGRWRDGDAAVIQSVQSRNCSLALASLKNDIGGLVEVFITDRRGVNVCQSNTTSDYYQADEVWWQNTRESRAAYTGPVEFDESVGGNAQAVHLPVLDPDDPDGDIIGIVRAVLRAEQQPVTEQLRPAPAP